MFISILAASGFGSKLVSDVTCNLFGILKLNFDIRVWNRCYLQTHFS